MSGQEVRKTNHLRAVVAEIKALIDAVEGNITPETLEAIDSVITSVGTYEGGADIATDLAAAVLAVGDENAGLVKDVADLATAVGTYEGGGDIATDLAAAVLAVGDENAGLVKDVADLIAVSDIPRTPIVMVDSLPDPLTVGVTGNPTGHAFIIAGGGDTNTIEFTLPTGAEWIGKDYLVIVQLSAGEGTACKIDVVSENDDAIEDAENGIYSFRCVDEAVWVLTSGPDQGA